MKESNLEFNPSYEYAKGGKNKSAMKKEIEVVVNGKGEKVSYSKELSDNQYKVSPKEALRILKKGRFNDDKFGQFAGLESLDDDDYNWLYFEKPADWDEVLEVLNEDNILVLVPNTSAGAKVIKPKSDRKTYVTRYPNGYNIRVKFGKENNLIKTSDELMESKSKSIAFAKRLAAKGNGSYMGYNSDPYDAFYKKSTSKSKGLKDAEYLPVSDIKGVKLKNGDIIHNSIVGYSSASTSIKDSRDFLSGVRYSNSKVFDAAEDKNQLEIFAKGGKSKNWQYIKRYDIDYIITDADKKIKGQNLYAGLWTEANEYNKRLLKGNSTKTKSKKRSTKSSNYAKGGYISIYENDGETEFEFELSDHSFDKTFKSLAAAKEFAKSKGYRVLDITEYKRGTAYAKGGWIDDSQKELNSKFGNHYGNNFWLLGTPINSSNEKRVKELIDEGILSPLEIDKKIRNYAKGGQTNDMRNKKYSEGGNISWEYKEFIADDFAEKAKAFAAEMEAKGYDTSLLFVNNGYGVEYRKRKQLSKGGKVLKKISTHKAVRNGDKIDIYINGFKIDGDVYPEEYLSSIPYENRDDLDSIFDDLEETNRINYTEFSDMEFAKGGKTKKFPVAVQRRVDEVNKLLIQIDERFLQSGSYAGSTHYAYITLTKPVEVRNNYVYIHSEKGRNDMFFQKRFNVNDTRDEYETETGRKSLMYDLGLIKRAFTKTLKDGYAKGGKTKSIMSNKKYNQGGSMLRQYDVNRNSGVGTYAKGGISNISSLTFNTAKELKQAIRTGFNYTPKFDASDIVSINGYNIKSIMPDITNTSVSIYDVSLQGIKHFFSPYIVKIKAGKERYSKGGEVEIEKAKRKLNKAKKTKISSAIDEAARELDRVSEKYGYAKGGDLPRATIGDMTYKVIKDGDGYNVVSSKVGMSAYKISSKPSSKDEAKELLNRMVKSKSYAKGGKTKEMYFIETEMNTKSGEKKYTYDQGIKRIKSLLKNDPIPFDGRELNSLSDDDVIELGFNHYGFDYSDSYAKGGKTDEVIMIEIGAAGRKKYPYYLKKIDTTHLSMANNKDGVDLVVPSHILQHKGESYYDDVRSWLKGGTSPDGKSYQSEYYAKGGKTSIVKGKVDRKVFNKLFEQFKRVADVSSPREYKSGLMTIQVIVDDVDTRNELIKYLKDNNLKYNESRFSKNEFQIIINKKMSDGGMVESYDVAATYGTYAKGGKLKESNIAYIDAVGSFGTSDDSWDLVTDILKKHNIEVDNSKDWHTKGYAEELFEDLDGQTIFTIKLDMNDSPNPKKLREEIINLPQTIDWQFTQDYAKGGKMQGYNAQLDESLAMRKGSKKTKEQSYKDRRDESKAMSKSMGRKAYSGVRSMDKMAKGGFVVMDNTDTDGREYISYDGENGIWENRAIFKSKKEAKDFAEGLNGKGDWFYVSEDEEDGFMAKGGNVNPSQITTAGQVDNPSELMNYAKGGTISKSRAVDLALDSGIDFNNDFFRESSSTNNAKLLELAKKQGYRQPKGASGSRVRYFYEYLQKEYNKNRQYYAKGGKTKGGINRDRQFLSQESHELAYATKRKKPFKRYKGRN